MRATTSWCVLSCITAVGERIPHVSSRANNCLDGTTSSIAKKEDLVR